MRDSKTALLFVVKEHLNRGVFYLVVLIGTFLIPFALIGGGLALKIWHELPAATKRYIAEVEKKGAPILAYGHSAIPTAKKD